jgi:hypothetical protein
VPPLSASFLSSSRVAASFIRAAPDGGESGGKTRTGHDKQTLGACLPVNMHAGMPNQGTVYIVILGVMPHVSHYSWQNHNLMPGISLLESVPTPDSIVPITQPPTPLCQKRKKEKS